MLAAVAVYEIDPAGVRLPRRLAGDELVDVAIRSPEVLPRRSWFAQQLDACPPQLVHGRGQVADGEADNRAGGEMLLARIAAAENLDMPPIRKLEDPEIRFRMHRPEAENMLVEARQFTAAACSRAAPSKARDLHACQYHRDLARLSKGVRLRGGGWCARQGRSTIFRPQWSAAPCLAHVGSSRRASGTGR